MNPIENLWGILVRKVYPNGKHYFNKEELRKGIFDAWESIEKKTLENLVDSMGDRLFMLASANGGPTKY